MRVLLISANTDTISMPTLPLGAAGVAAATRGAGHDVILLNLMFEEDPNASVQHSIEHFRPDVIGVSVRNIDDQNMAETRFLLAPVKEVITNCRSLSEAPIVLGGAGYSIFPQSALEYLGADVGVQSEGEVVFPLLVDRLGKGREVSDLPGVHLSSRFSSLPRTRDSTAGADPRSCGGDNVCSFQRGDGADADREPRRRVFVENLDELPLPEPSLWIPPGAGKRKLWVPVQSRRGCPLDCAYCSTSLIEGRGIRRRSPVQVVKWLAQLRETDCRNFNFVDNTFNLPLDYAKDLCRHLIRAELDLNLWTIIYPKWVDTELVELMRLGGCRQVSIGFESGSNEMLRSLGKQFDQEEIRAISRMFGEAGIERMGFLLLGGPGERRDSVEESLSFAESLHLEALKITVGIRIYPQTPLAKTALAAGLIRAEEDLLVPKFYVPPILKDWLPERIAAYKASRPWVN
jgi:radical SAM superfamily enzyme YgiQ (UPF0313 family)